MTYGEWTYRSAWALEITAAIIGLGTGLALGYLSFVEGATSGTSNATRLILQSAPFFMVALAELTKIPIATLLFSISWPWKPLILIFLIALAAITFLTMFINLDTAASARQYSYEELTKSIGVQKLEADSIKEAINQLQSGNQIVRLEAEIESLNEQANKVRASIQSQILQIDKDIEGQSVLSPEMAAIRNSLQEREKSRDSLVAERGNQIKEAMAQFVDQRTSFERRIKDAREAGDTTSVRKYEDELAKLANPRKKITDQYEGKIVALEAEITTLREKLDDARANAQPLSTQQRKVLEKRRADYNARLDQANDNWGQQVDNARSRLSEAQNQSANKDQIIEDNRKKLDLIGKNLSELESKRIPEARSDQSRSIASRIYGVKPEDVTDKQASFITVIWIGSLAFLAALAGPFAAMVALGLQRIASQSETQTKASKLSRLFRNILIRWRWKRVKTVSVVKEVPVEKIIKEILYIPLLTDDPAVVDKALRESIPAEVAELIKMSVSAKAKEAPSAS